jgi:tetratricopeptide (TPR) repeat protein
VARVGQLIQRRLGRLSADAVQLARCAAIAAPDFSVELAAQVLGQRPLQLADPWAELEAAQVLRPDGQFAHDLIHEAARASVPRAVARHLHGEIAAFLVARGVDPGRTAPHWALAGQWRPAAEAFERAAAQAGAAGRVAERCARLADAARCWGEAGETARRFDTLLQRAMTLVPNDSGEAAREALDAAEAAAQTDAERLHVQAARLELAVSRFDVDEALRVAPPALEQARALGDGELVRRLSIVYAAALGDARRTAEGVRVLEPLAGVMHRRDDDGPKWEFFEAFALALDYDGRLRSAAAQWQECQRLARVLQRTDLLWRSLSNGAASLGKLGRMAEAVELSAQAWQLARTLGETGRVRLLQMQLPHAGRLRDVGRYAEALPLLEECLAGLRAEGSATDAALAEQRLAVLFLQLGQPARAVPLLAQDRERVPPGVRLFHRVLQAEVARLTGGDALAPMREALAMVPNRDDIFHRMACLYATAVLPDDEADREAQDLVAWAAAHERQGLELAARVRAAGTALRGGDAARALPHVQAARELVAQYRPDSFYVGELWLTGARVFDTLGRADEADACARDGAAYVQTLAAQVPAAFVESFLQRNAVNRELLARAAQAAQAAQGR